jgi:hypothetical protein
LFRGCHFSMLAEGRETWKISRLCAGWGLCAIVVPDESRFLLSRFARASE